MIAEFWKTTTAMRAHLDVHSWLMIPSKETFEVALRDGSGNLRIYWPGSKEGLSGLTINEADLHSCAERM